MAAQMELSEPEDEKPIISKSKPPFQPSSRRRILLISALIVLFVFPVVVVLSISLPSVVGSSKATQRGILSYAHLAESWHLPGLEDPGKPTIPTRNLIHTSELSLNTSFTVSSRPTVREYQFNITQAYGAPDGFRKLMILANGQSPGPLIEAYTGDTVRVIVHNQLGNMSTSIHWHGIDQKNSSWMDGVTGVTQCAIPPGESLTYEFQLIDQRGTFWYHAHTTMQYTDGLFGPIVWPPPLPLAQISARSYFNPDYPRHRRTSSQSRRRPNTLHR
jgi:FtsP/CotA-like multicopper oxidase with cupredoxin domain